MKKTAENRFVFVGRFSAEVKGEQAGVNRMTEIQWLLRTLESANFCRYETGRTD